MRPHLSIDIETTGIDDKSHILQIAAVFDDLKSPVENLLTFNQVIRYDVMTHCEPYAIGMNAELFKRLMNRDTGTDPESAAFRFVNFLTLVQEIQLNMGLSPKLIVSGKNVASFDIPKLKKFVEEYKLNINNLLHYKTLDVGSLYYDTFGDNVSLSEINKLTGRKEVSHDALEDALDVVYAVRYKLGVSKYGEAKETTV